MFSISDDESVLIFVNSIKVNNANNKKIHIGFIHTGNEIKTLSVD
jgi:hypothetical protein